eukprot:Clim_evm69s149 gene=Clim_evmTU69s149
MSDNEDESASSKHGELTSGDKNEWNDSDGDEWNTGGGDEEEWGAGGEDWNDFEASTAQPPPAPNEVAGRIVKEHSEPKTICQLFPLEDGLYENITTEPLEQEFQAKSSLKGSNVPNNSLWGRLLDNRTANAVSQLWNDTHTEWEYYRSIDDKLPRLVKPNGISRGQTRSDVYNFTCRDLQDMSLRLEAELRPLDVKIREARKQREELETQREVRQRFIASVLRVMMGYENLNRPSPAPQPANRAAAFFLNGRGTQSASSRQPVNDNGKNTVLQPKSIPFRRSLDLDAIYQLTILLDAINEDVMNIATLLQSYRQTVE